MWGWGWGGIRWLMFHVSPSHADDWHKILNSYLSLKTLCRAIEIQWHEKNPATIPRKCTRRKQIKSEFILSTFCFWKWHRWKSFQHYWKNHCVYLVPLKQQKVDKKQTHFWLVYVPCIFAEWPLDFYHASGFLSPCIVWKSTILKFRLLLILGGALIVYFWDLFLNRSNLYHFDWINQFVKF